MTSILGTEWSIRGLFPNLEVLLYDISGLLATRWNY
jgi:hypothetical protein